MHVLILGGYGFIGLEAARRLVETHRVSALGRAPEQAARTLPGANWIKATSRGSSVRKNGGRCSPVSMWS